MSLLRSLLYYILFYGGSAMLVMGSAAASYVGRRPLKVFVSMWTDWHRWCVTRLLGIEVRIEGEIPQEPVIIAMKHESFFEAIDAPTLLDFPSVFAKQELFNIPGWGRAARVYGLTPVARDDGAKALRQMLTAAKQRLAEGRPLVIFPEGTRVAHGSTPKLQAGFAGIYKMLRVPVVPVAVNSGPIYRRHLKHPGTITYRFGEMIPAGLPRAEAESRVHEAINALNPPACDP